MKASRDTWLRCLDICDSVRILVAIFLTCLHMHKDFMHFFLKILTQISRLKQKHCAYVGVGKFLTVKSGFLSPFWQFPTEIFGPAHMDTNIGLMFWVISYTKIVKNARNLCVYVGFSKYFEKYPEKYHLFNKVY